MESFRGIDQENITKTKIDGLRYEQGKRRLALHWDY